MSVWMSWLGGALMTALVGLVIWHFKRDVTKGDKLQERAEKSAVADAEIREQVRALQAETKNLREGLQNLERIAKNIRLETERRVEGLEEATKKTRYVQGQVDTLVRLLQVQFTPATDAELEGE